MYEKIELVGVKVLFQFWFGINVMILYQFDMKKDKLLLLGFYLVFGIIIEDFYSKLIQLLLMF